MTPDQILAFVLYLTLPPPAASAFPMPDGPRIPLTFIACRQ